MPVYIIQAGETEFVKIGWAEDVTARLYDLQGGHYDELSVIRVIDGPRTVEAWFHRYFITRRVRREWFRFVPEMLSVSPPTLADGNGGPATHAALLSEIEAFLRINPMAETTFGRLAVNDGKFMGRLRANANMTLATLQKVRAFIRSLHPSEAA